MEEGRVLTCGLVGHCASNAASCSSAKWSRGCIVYKQTRVHLGQSGVDVTVNEEGRQLMEGMLLVRD
jgi:hypothetical protein